jgi:multisubunit Na+/H+ antiporter MnhG subunit
MGAKAILIAILLFLSNPVLSHATARAGRVRRRQQLPPVRGEDFPVSRDYL